MKKIRLLKVGKKYRRMSWRGKFVPAITLQGIWLEQANFSIGGQCSIAVEQGRIIITEL